MEFNDKKLTDNVDNFKTRLLEIGLNPTQIAAVLKLRAEEAFQANEKLLAIRARARDKKRRQRANKINDPVPGTNKKLNHINGHVPGTVLGVVPGTEKPEQNQQSCPRDSVRYINSKKERYISSDTVLGTADFDKFWELWPNTVGKKKAFIAFNKAIKIADLQTILAGVQNYIANKPEKQDWCHPTTWLNGERWNDKFPPKSPAKPTQLWLGGIKGVI